MKRCRIISLSLGIALHSIKCFLFIVKNLENNDPIFVNKSTTISRGNVRICAKVANLGGQKKYCEQMNTLSLSDRFATGVIKKKVL